MSGDVSDETVLMAMSTLSEVGVMGVTLVGGGWWGAMGVKQVGAEGGPGG